MPLSTRDYNKTASLLAQAENMQYQFAEVDVLTLNFSLPSGTYATALLLKLEIISPSSHGPMICWHL